MISLWRDQDFQQRSLPILLDITPTKKLSPPPSLPWSLTTYWQKSISHSCYTNFTKNFAWGVHFHLHNHDLVTQSWQLFPDRQFSFYLWWTLKQLVSNSQLYLIFIDTYNKHLFKIILKIHIFAISRGTTDVFFIHSFCFDMKIVKPFLFLFQYSIETSLHINAFIYFYHFCQRHFVKEIK